MIDCFNIKKIEKIVLILKHPKIYEIGTILKSPYFLDDAGVETKLFGNYSIAAFEIISPTSGEYYKQVLELELVNNFFYLIYDEGYYRTSHNV